jgi:hypothetical protein
MNNWYVGQKVVCVDPYLEDGLVCGPHYVTLVEVCEHCGLVGLGVGIKNRMAYASGCSYCSQCGSSEDVGDEETYRASRFRPLDMLNAAIERIEVEAVEEVKELQHI